MSVRILLAVALCSFNVAAAFPQNSNSPSVTAEPSLNDQTSYSRWLLAEGDKPEKSLLEERSAAFLAKYPNDPNAPAISFNYMLALRAVKKWPEARAVARKLGNDYAQSSYARLLGGNDGRTEDQAAFRFSAIVKSYGEKQFDTCCDLIVDFIKQFPNNWRVPDAWKYYCYAVYHARDEKRFFEISEKVLAENLDPRSEANILYLQASFLVQQGRGAEARNVLARIRKDYPKSGLGRSGQLDQLALETYLYGTNRDSINAETEGLENIFSLLGAQLRTTQNHPTWYLKNVFMAQDLYTRTGRGAEFETVITDALKTTASEPKTHLSILKLAYQHHARHGSLDQVEPFIDAAAAAFPEGVERQELLGLSASLQRRSGNIEAAQRLVREQQDSNWSLR